MINNLESAHMFTPGRASYITTDPNQGLTLNLTDASQGRADTAAALFDAEFHTVAVFAGGYPGIAQNWPPEHTPPLGHREADLMAVPLETRLKADGWNDSTIAEHVKRQGKSNNSIGDVLISIEEGILDPNDFHRGNDRHGIHLVSGGLHAVRFREILEKGLDINKNRIVRADIRDPYGTPATEFHAREPRGIAVAKEIAAIALTRFVLRKVRPGNVDDLREAENRFNAIATNQ